MQDGKSRPDLPSCKPDPLVTRSRGTLARHGSAWPVDQNPFEKRLRLRIISRLGRLGLRPILRPKRVDGCLTTGGYLRDLGKRAFMLPVLTRVDEKCREDPSLGVAHGCFWKYHPARAWAWELRLQDEIGPDFRIEEAPYRGDGGHAAHRAAFLEEHPEAALAAVEKEVLRRRRKQKQPQPELNLLESGLWTRNPDLCCRSHSLDSVPLDQHDSVLDGSTAASVNEQPCSDCLGHASLLSRMVQSARNSFMIEL